MDMLDTAAMPWGESLVPQRSDDTYMAHKRLFEGDEDSPDNYMLVLSREPSSYFSPRHRHPWDQVRYCLDGKIPIAKGLYVEGGEIAYFPENTYYGPQQGGENRHVLLLQFGGASGRGFIGPDRLKQARAELALSGTFDKGVYSRTKPGGGRMNIDAYEAIWRHVKGDELHYTPVLHKTPSVMRPEAWEWQPTTFEGCCCKAIARFPHRNLAIDFFRVSKAELPFDPTPDQRRFLYVIEGSGRVNQQPARGGSAVRVEPGEGLMIESDSLLICLSLSVGLHQRGPQ